jgi:hypothetical protein
MRLTLGVLAVVVSLALVGPAAAETDTFNATGRLADKGTDAKGRERFSGPIRSPGFGDGTGTYLATVNTDGTTFADFSSRFEFGTLRGKTKGTVTTDANGGSTFSGTGKITGGTRAYKHGKGTFKYSGRSLPNGSITFKLKGKVTFPAR